MVLGRTEMVIEAMAVLCPGPTRTRLGKISMRALFLFSLVDLVTLLQLELEWGKRKCLRGMMFFDRFVVLGTRD